MAHAMSNNATARLPVVTLLLNSSSCKKYLASMRQFEQQVNTARIRYNPRYRNSNGVAYGLLEIAGVPQANLFQHKAPIVGYDSTIIDIVRGRGANQSLRRLWLRLPLAIRRAINPLEGAPLFQLDSGRLVDEASCSC